MGKFLTIRKATTPLKKGLPS